MSDLPEIPERPKVTPYWPGLTDRLRDPDYVHRYSDIVGFTAAARIDELEGALASFVEWAETGRHLGAEDRLPRLARTAKQILNKAKPEEERNP